MTNRLSVVPPDAKPPKKPRRKQTPKSISEALAGSNRDVLAAMRKALAKKLDDGDVSSNAIASAYKELRELDRLIRQIDAHEEQEATRRGDVSDEAFDASAV
jgi:hypothetical protein